MLLDREYAARLPGGSPRSRVPTRESYSDRFIPVRAGLNLHSTYNILKSPETTPQVPVTSPARTPVRPAQLPNSLDISPDLSSSSLDSSKDEPRVVYSMALKSEILGDELLERSNAVNPHDGTLTHSSILQYSHKSPSVTKKHVPATTRSHYYSRAASTSPIATGRAASQNRSTEGVKDMTIGLLPSIPMGKNTLKLLSSPKQPVRHIAKTPFKVLEAPAIQDDFYLNLLDWSSQNVLAVGLRSSVYLWNAVTLQVTKLIDLGDTDLITAVCWMPSGAHLAVGSLNGSVNLWDIAKETIVCEFCDHNTRVGIMSSNGNCIASGGRDRCVYIRDVRSPRERQKLVAHRQEVCGLKWAPEGRMLASGGNDNKLLLWDVNQISAPLYQHSEHIAAIKALAWSPHQRGLLASGGGTADRCIRFWNTLNDSCLNCIDTGSQVCNLAWSNNVNEIVSTHGYSQNQIVLWSYPSMSQLATLTGHTTRVLFLAVSPDGQTIVTGAGDETLRFWNVFPEKARPSGGRISSGTLLRRSDIR